MAVARTGRGLPEGIMRSGACETLPPAPRLSAQRLYQCIEHIPMRGSPILHLGTGIWGVRPRGTAGPRVGPGPEETLRKTPTPGLDPPESFGTAIPAASAFGFLHRSSDNPRLPGAPSVHRSASLHGGPPRVPAHDAAVLRHGAAVLQGLRRDPQPAECPDHRAGRLHDLPEGEERAGGKLRQGPAAPRAQRPAGRAELAVRRHGGHARGREQ